MRNLLRLSPAALTICICVAFAPAAEPFDSHGRIRVAQAGTHLEHADGTPFFFLADTCWTGPALSTADDWDFYLRDRKKKGFTAIQFNMVSPWRTAPTDAEGRIAYSLAGGKFAVNEAFYAERLDPRLKAINDHGLLAVPVLCWALKKGDAGVELNESQLLTLIRFEVERYRSAHVLWILAGDNRYTPADAEKWRRIGRAVFAENPTGAPVTTHPTGQNWPWESWRDEKWLTVLGYQSGHGDSDETWNWLHHGPPAAYGKKPSGKPVINLEPPYEDHNGYASRKPHPAYHVRRAIYWSLLQAPIAGVTYGGHGVWSWHEKPGQTPTDHPGSGVAKVWRDALQLPGANQMGHLHTLMKNLPWTELRPAPELVSQDEANAQRFVAVAATPDRKTVVAYFPIGGKATFVTKGVTEGATIRWFNPASGAFQSGDEVAPPNLEQDWVLIVRR